MAFARDFVKLSLWNELCTYGCHCECVGSFVEARIITNQIFVSALAPRRTEEKKNIKGKCQSTQKPKFPLKSSFLESPIDP